MILVTSDSVPGYKIVKTIGLVRGSCIKAKHLGRDIAAGLKGMIGGELKGYSELLDEARETAIERLILDAEKKGANAVITIRLSTSSVMAGAAEMLAYGTAVVVEEEKP